MNAQRATTENREETEAMAHDELLQEHERTWQGFMRLSAIFAAHVVVILALMAIFLL